MKIEIRDWKLENRPPSRKSHFRFSNFEFRIFEFPISIFEFRVSLPVIRYPISEGKIRKSLNHQMTR